MNQPDYFETLEEKQKLRAGTQEYYDYNGRLCKREWDEEGIFSKIYQWTENNWEPRPNWQSVIDMEGENLTEEQVRLLKQNEK